jgi:cytochrome c oxidase cbb3-type subunit 2
MPRYGWLQRNELSAADLSKHLAAQRALGVPYTEEMVEQAARDAYGQSNPDSDYAEGVAERYGEATNIRSFDGEPNRLTEMDAMVAYLQVLGRLTSAAYDGGAQTEE